MRKLLAVAAAALLFPMAAAAAEITIGAALGYSIPMGDAAKNEKMTDGVKGAIPLELSVNYGVMPNLEVGLYGGYDFGLVGSTVQKDVCDPAGLDCSVYGYRVGVQAEYLFGHGAELTPFAGLNVGWAWETLKSGKGSDWVKLTESGWEIGLKGGVDKKVSEQLKVGAFVGIAFGQYGSTSVSYSSAALGTDSSESIPSSEKALHEWLTIGVRGTFGL
jgi:hypothetical protein